MDDAIGAIHMGARYHKMGSHMPPDAEKSCPVISANTFSYKYTK